MNPGSCRRFATPCCLRSARCRRGAITSLLLAVLVNRAIKRIYFFRSMFYPPVVSSFVSVQLIWLWMYEPQFGLANEFLIWLGLPTSKWLRGPETALLSIIIMSNWKNMGLNMVIYLAGRQSIPPHLYEAAEIDGAGRISKMFRIVISLLAPTTYFVVIVYFIGALQMFVRVLLMTCAEGTARCGGPLDSTTTIVLLIYDEAFGLSANGVCGGAHIPAVRGDRGENPDQFQAARIRNWLLAPELRPGRFLLRWLAWSCSAEPIETATGLTKAKQLRAGRRYLPQRAIQNFANGRCFESIHAAPVAPGTLHPVAGPAPIIAGRRRSGYPNPAITAGRINI